MMPATPLLPADATAFVLVAATFESAAGAVEVIPASPSNPANSTIHFLMIRD